MGRGGCLRAFVIPKVRVGSYGVHCLISLSQSRCELHVAQVRVLNREYAFDHRRFQSFDWCIEGMRCSDEIRC